MIVGGYMSWTIAQGLQTTIDRHSSTGKIAGIMLMSGVSAGFTFQTFVSVLYLYFFRVAHSIIHRSLLAAQAAVPRHEMAVVTGVRNFLRIMGSTLALAVAGTCILLRYIFCFLLLISL
jgi:hypothetical protein